MNKGNKTIPHFDEDRLKGVNDPCGSSDLTLGTPGTQMVKIHIVKVKDVDIIPAVPCRLHQGQSTSIRYRKSYQTLVTAASSDKTLAEAVSTDGVTLGST